MFVLSTAFFSKMSAYKKKRLSFSKKLAIFKLFFLCLTPQSNNNVTFYLRYDS